MQSTDLTSNDTPDPVATKPGEPSKPQPTTAAWRRTRLVALMLVYLLVEAILIVVVAYGDRHELLETRGLVIFWGLVIFRGLVIIALFSVMMAQTVLLAGWLAWGDGSWLVRLALLVAGILGSQVALYLSVSDYPVGIFLVVSLAQVVLINPPLMIARGFGWALRVETESSPKPSWQFSVRQTLLLTAVVAISLRLLLWLPWEDMSSEFSEIVIFTLATTAGGWIAWPLIPRYRAWIAYPVVVAVSVLVGIIFNSLQPHGGTENFALPVMQTMLIAVCLSWVRAAGYRLSKV